jgi:predicted Zn-dependent protease
MTTPLPARSRAAAAPASRRRAAAVMAGILAVALVGCRSTGPGGPVIGGTDRVQPTAVLITEAQLREAAGQAQALRLAELRRTGATQPDAALAKRVAEVARRLIGATAAVRGDAPGWGWDVVVVGSDRLDAWCLSGGRCVVHSGLVARLGLTDDEIAALLAHEFAHVLREHPRERAALEQGVAAAIAESAADLGVPAGTADLAVLAYAVGARMPNGRAHEVEADRLGVELAARAGFDPRAALTLWQRLSAQAECSAAAWATRHPSTNGRAENLAGYAERVMPLYLQARP